MHPSNHLFPSFILKIGERYKPVWYNRRNIPSRQPLRQQSQRSCITNPLVLPDPRASKLLSEEGLDDRSQRPNHLDMTTVAMYRCAYARANTKRCTGISLGDTRVIITKVHCNKTARDHADTEASSRSAPYPYRDLLKHLHPVT